MNDVQIALDAVRAGRLDEAAALKPEWFLQGNASMLKRYGESFPWREPGRNPAAVD